MVSGFAFSSAGHSWAVQVLSREAGTHMSGVWARFPSTSGPSMRFRGFGLFYSQQTTLYFDCSRGSFKPTAASESLIRTNADTCLQTWQWKVYAEINVVIRKKNFLWSLLKSVEAKSSWGTLALILGIIFCEFVCGKVSWQARQSS